ncbi:small ribosomal subunit protein bS18m [Amia ocellicauda]|uniref:small ribosomal subunit protein bS18m n=1 Tax=Amia ocellicauda TaxID=2972642 RepID=UPI0034646594
MSVVRNFRTVKSAVLKATLNNPGQWQRSLSNAQHEIPTASNDMPIKMENPYKEPPKRCILCGVTVDFKNVQLLSQFVSPHTGFIYGRHITGLCGKKQKQVSKAIKKAQHMGFMPVTLKHPAFLKDPNICNIKHPE